jgi:tetratricopeptide (TPR) repeat protein
MYPSSSTRLRLIIPMQTNYRRLCDNQPPRELQSQGVLLLALLAISLCGCAPSSEGPPSSDSGFRDESQYIVHSIVLDLAMMLEYAQNEPAFTAPRVHVVEKDDSPIGRPVYTLHVTGRHPVEVELTVDRPIWDPSLYDDVTTKLLPKIPQVDTTGISPIPAPTNLLEQLAHFNVENLESASRSISDQLTRVFLDPVTHERAALVLGVFGLREASGDFYDVRSVLCRMTTHLAIARRLSGGVLQTTDGSLANTLLLVLMGNQKDALASLETLVPDANVLPWIRALRARITGDYRELNAATDPLTVVERVCQFEALCRSLDGSVAWETITARESESRTDYSRWINSYPRSVQMGHILNRLSLRLEMAEAAEVLRLVHAWDSDREPDWSILNVEPSPCVTLARNGTPSVNIIGWNHWAMFLQRHISHGLQQHFYFLMRLWSVPEAAKEFADIADARFLKMRLYPFVQLANATTDNEFRVAAAKCARLIQETPHLFGPTLWNRFYQPPRGVASYQPPGLWDVCEWHKHNPPPFTGYMVRSRLNHLSFIHPPDALNLLKALHERAPFNPDAARALLHLRHGRQGDKAPIESLEAAYGPMLEYSVPQMALVARLATNNPAFYQRYMERAASLRPLHYFELGDYLIAREQPDEAAGCYEKGVAQCDDAVAVANRSRWLVLYYFENNRMADAELLANRAADTYSYQGLKTKGDLLYWQGQYDESLSYYQKIDERYHAPYAVVQWWADYRGRTNDARFDAEIEKRMNTLFPRGVETVTLKSFEGQPDEGVKIRGENELIRQAGLKENDIIVAINGRRIYDLPQYLYVRSQLTNPEMHFICWDGQRYVERSASPPHYRFGVPFQSWSTR